MSLIILIKIIIIKRMHFIVVMLNEVYYSKNKSNPINKIHKIGIIFRRDFAI